MHVTVWFAFFGGSFQCQNPWFMGGKRDNEGWDLNWGYLFPRVLGYKRGSGIMESGITKVRLYGSSHFNLTEGHFTHKTESPWPVHFKHSHRWKKAKPVQVPLTIRLRDQWSMWMQRWMLSLHGILHGIQWIMSHGHSNYFQKPPLGGRPNTKLDDHGTPNTHNHWSILFHHAWGSAWREIHWNGIWLRARSHMTSHYTRGSVTTQHDLGGVLGGQPPLDTFLLGSHNSRSRLLARVWSSP